MFLTYNIDINMSKVDKELRSRQRKKNIPEASEIVDSSTKKSKTKSKKKMTDKKEEIEAPHKINKKKTKDDIPSDKSPKKRDTTTS